MCRVKLRSYMLTGDGQMFIRKEPLQKKGLTNLRTSKSRLFKTDQHIRINVLHNKITYVVYRSVTVNSMSPSTSIICGWTMKFGHQGWVVDQNVEQIAEENLSVNEYPLRATWIKARRSVKCRLPIDVTSTKHGCQRAFA